MLRAIKAAVKRMEDEDFTSQHVDEVVAIRLLHTAIQLHTVSQARR